MRISHTDLSAAALRGIIEDYITREGTDYGDREYSLDDKVAQVQAQIERGEVIITFDPEAETCSLVAVGELKKTHE